MKQIRCLLIVTCISSFAFGQNKVSRWIKADRAGCMVAYENTANGDSAGWSGACKGGKAFGEGVLTWYRGAAATAAYEGTMLDGRLHGRGSYTWANGMQQKGNFRYGQFLDLDDTLLSQLQKNTLPVKDTADNYVSDGEDQTLFYYSLVPPGTIKGVLVLLPGTWETAEHDLSSNRVLCRQAYDKGIAVLVPSINQRLAMTDDVLALLNRFFKESILQYRLPADRFVLGGWSAGGLFSIRYAAYAAESAALTVIQPKAVFSVDGPTDLEHLHAKWTRDLVNPRNTNKYEPEYALHELEQYLGGSPADFHSRYVHYSVFSMSEPDGGTAKYLTHIPLRIYCDVDVNWWLTNRGTDLYGMNALDQSAMINFLNGAGNERAMFINAYGKGYRLEGYRHPHSWSIVDPEECIGWILSCLP